MKILTVLFGWLLQFPEPSYMADGDTAEDTNTQDTQDTQDTNDSGGDTGEDTALKSATELAGENGGFGCSALGTGSAVALWSSVLLIGLRREE